MIEGFEKTVDRIRECSIKKLALYGGESFNYYAARMKVMDASANRRKKSCWEVNKTTMKKKMMMVRNGR